MGVYSGVGGIGGGREWVWGIGGEGKEGKGVERSCRKEVSKDVPTLVGGGRPNHHSATFNHHSS